VGSELYISHGTVNALRKFSPCNVIDALRKFRACKRPNIFVIYLLEKYIGVSYGSWITNQGFGLYVLLDAMSSRLWKWNGEVSPLACPSKRLLRGRHCRISCLYISQTRRESNWICASGMRDSSGWIARFVSSFGERDETDV
jgi:hypothetical protein